MNLINKKFLLIFRKYTQRSILVIRISTYLRQIQAIWPFCLNDDSELFHSHESIFISK